METCKPGPAVRDNPWGHLLPSGGPGSLPRVGVSGWPRPCPRLCLTWSPGEVAATLVWRRAGQTSTHALVQPGTKAPPRDRRPSAGQHSQGLWSASVGPSPPSLPQASWQNPRASPSGFSLCPRSDFTCFQASGAAAGIPHPASLWLILQPHDASSRLFAPVGQRASHGGAEGGGVDTPGSSPGPTAPKALQQGGARCPRPFPSPLPVLPRTSAHISCSRWNPSLRVCSQPQAGASPRATSAPSLPPRSPVRALSPKRFAGLSAPLWIQQGKWPFPSRLQGTIPNHGAA